MNTATARQSNVLPMRRPRGRRAPAEVLTERLAELVLAAVETDGPGDDTPSIWESVTESKRATLALHAHCAEENWIELEADGRKFVLSLEEVKSFEEIHTTAYTELLAQVARREKAGRGDERHGRVGGGGPKA